MAQKKKAKGKAVAEPEELSESDQDDYDVSASDEDSEDLAGNEDDNEEDLDGEGGELVNVDFDFFDPKPDDFHGLRALLQNYLDTSPFDVSGFTDAIIEQTTVGTVVRTAEDEAPVGVMTVLNLHTHKALPALAQTLAHLKAKADAATKPALEAALEAAAAGKAGARTGLVVSERLVNCPPQLCEPLTGSLMDEIQWATEDEPTEAKRQSFKFDRYLVFTRVCREEEAANDRGSSGSGQGSKGKAKKKKGDAPTYVYVRPEDEILHQLAEWSCAWPVEGKPVTDGLLPCRLLLSLQAGQVAEVRSRLRALVASHADS